jgi:hypothetical protein
VLSESSVPRRAPGKLHRSGSVRFVADIVPFIAKYWMLYGPISRLCSLSVALCWAAIHAEPYDNLSRLTSLATQVGGTGNNISENLSYTVSNQLKARDISVQNQSYIYSPANVATAYGVNALNQIITANGVALGYDGRGNLTTDNLGGSYSYNANNLLTRSGNVTAFIALISSQPIRSTSARRQNAIAIFS